MAETEQPIELPPATVAENVLAPTPVDETIVEQAAPVVSSAAPVIPIQSTFLSEDSEFVLAKSFLTSKVGAKHPVSLYDHLTNIIMQSLESRNTNVVDNFEQLSLQIKQNQFSMDPLAPTSVRTIAETDIQYPVAKKRVDMYKRVSAEDGTEAGDIPDMLDLANLWEWAGVSFGKEETFLLFLSIKKLVETKQLKSVRLWGKIYGCDQNYIIAEGELKDGAQDEDDAIANPPQPEKSEKKEEKNTKVNLPKPKVFAPLSKETRSGVNKYVYYCTNSVGGAWTRLPDVIPERLQESRKIHKYFTGHLDHQIESYPAFGGNEAQYLRCQIARISAATVVSPKGYYMTDPEAEESEEGAGNTPIIINPEYEGLSNEQLTNVANWVHHTPYILPQGKVIWEAPKVVKEPVEGESEKDDEEEEAEEEVIAEPETGPAPLNFLASDEDHGSIPAWTARVCAQAIPIKFSPVTLRSNRWPGASVLAYNDKFANIYVGDGLKNLVQSFVVPPLPTIQMEYASGEIATGNPELLVEQIDPTVEQEEAYEEEQRAKGEDGKDAAGEEGEEEAEE